MVTILDTHLFSPNDLHLHELPQIFSASALWYEEGMNDQIATFDLTVRDMPLNRNFLLFGGLEELVTEIQKWHYTDEEVNYLLKNGVITKGFADYLRNFKFTGYIKAMPEGTIFFPGEPILRITAPLSDVNLFTMFLFHVVTGNTKFLSKVIRSKLAASPKTCIGVGVQRSNSFESAIKCSRAAYIAGLVGPNSYPSLSRKFNLPYDNPLTIAYHAVIKSFPSEIEAMRKMAFTYGGRVNLMVDTYDFEKGVRNAITVIKECKSKKLNLPGITIDSGDLYDLCVRARKLLDIAGLRDVRITLASNLDEHRIKVLNDKKVPADAFLVGTEVASVSDAPTLEVVFKLAEIKRVDGETVYCAKLSPGKESYPGRKQVFRINEKEKMKKDIIGLEEENLGRPLLVDIFQNGKVIYSLPSLDEIREYVWKQISQLPDELLVIDKYHQYDVQVSPKLTNLFRKLQKEHS